MKTIVKPIYCRTCSARILWATSIDPSIAAKNVKLDADPAPRGRFELVGFFEHRQVTRATSDTPTWRRYTASTAAGGRPMLERCQTCPVTVANELDVAAGDPPRFAHYETIERVECHGPSVFVHTDGLMARCRGHQFLSPCMPYAEWADVVLDPSETT